MPQMTYPPTKPAPAPPTTLSQLTGGNIVEPDQISRPDWLVGPCGRTRDSDAVERANYTTAVAALAEVDPEGLDFEVLRWTHWACGWVVEVVTRPGSRAADVAAELRARLAEYPVLDEAAWSREEELEVADVVSG